MSIVILVRVVFSVDIGDQVRNIVVLSMNKINEKLSRKPLSEMVCASFAPSGAKIKLQQAIIARA